MVTDSDRLSAAVAGTVFTDVGWVPETTSTNADLIRAARAGAAHGTVLVADHQTAGRGRHGRTWVDRPSEALLLSILLRPDGTVDPGWLVSAVSVALVEAVRDLGADAWLKWPNDVMVASPRDSGTDRVDRKLAGVLAESVIEGSRITAVVVGVGCNVRAGAVVGVDGATAVDIEAPEAAPVARADLAAALLTNLDSLLGRHGGLLPTGTTAGAIIERYRRHSGTLGRRVRLDLHDRSVVGVAVDVDADGRLVVDHDGERLVVTAGDVVHLRPLDAGGVE